MLRFVILEWKICGVTKSYLNRKIKFMCHTYLFIIDTPSTRLSVYKKGKTIIELFVPDHKILELVQLRSAMGTKPRGNTYVRAKYLIGFVVHTISSSSTIKKFPRNSRLTSSCARNQQYFSILL